MPGASLLLRNGRPMGGQASDVLVTDGVIAAIGPALTAAPGTPVEDAGGRWSCPAWSRPIPIWTSRCSACPGTATKSGRA